MWGYTKDLGRHLKIDLRYLKNQIDKKTYFGMIVLQLFYQSI